MTFIFVIGIVFALAVGYSVVGGAFLTIGYFLLKSKLLPWAIFAVIAFVVISAFRGRDNV